MTPFRPQRLPIISLLLLVLLARALVPAGFMPSADGSAQLTLCPDGMLMPADGANAAGAGTHSGYAHTDHCPFGSAPFAAPLADLPVIPVRAVAIGRLGIEPSLWTPSTRVARTHQPRAPPHLNLV